MVVPSVSCSSATTEKQRSTAVQHLAGCQRIGQLQLDDVCIQDSVLVDSTQGGDRLATRRFELLPTLLLAGPNAF
jgi:hypothetical protein